MCRMFQRKYNLTAGSGQRVSIAAFGMSGTLIKTNVSDYVHVRCESHTVIDPARVQKVDVPSVDSP